MLPRQLEEPSLAAGQHARRLAGEPREPDELQEVSRPVPEAALLPGDGVRPDPVLPEPLAELALASEYGLGNLVLGARVARIAPVSREMILNFVAQFSLGLPKSY